MKRTVVYPTLDIELELWREGYSRVAGVDEVGMGPLAGPVVAAAVVLPPVSGKACADAFPKGVRDSKTLTQVARERLEPEILKVAVGVGIGVVGVDDIDKFNVYQAGLKAMRLALDQLPQPCDYALLDGRMLKNWGNAQRAISKGDLNVYSIAAASIIAKTYRDSLMVQLDANYPEYGFARHKGYGTVAHRNALREYGPCLAHRRSFRLV